MLRILLPRFILSVLLLSGAVFAFFESVYLRDQAIEFHEEKITLWMWAFRGITAMLAIGGLAIYSYFP
jgi:hypothetical protein